MYSIVWCEMKVGFVCQLNRAIDPYHLLHLGVIWQVNLALLYQSHPYPVLHPPQSTLISSWWSRLKPTSSNLTSLALGPSQSPHTACLAMDLWFSRLMSNLLPDNCSSWQCPILVLASSPCHCPEWVIMTAKPEMVKSSGSFTDLWIAPGFLKVDLLGPNLSTWMLSLD